MLNYAKIVVIRALVIGLVAFVLTVLVTIWGQLIWFFPTDWFLYLAHEVYGAFGQEDIVDFAFILNFIMLFILTCIAFLIFRRAKKRSSEK